MWVPKLNSQWCSHSLKLTTTWTRKWRASSWTPPRPSQWQCQRTSSRAPFSHFRWLAWPVHSTSAMILLSLLGFSYRMVTRLCYEEARNMDNITDCVNTNKERAGWDCRWGWTLYTKTAEGVVSGREACTTFMRRSLLCRKPTRRCIVMTTQLVIMPTHCVLCDNKDVIGFPTLNISWNGAGEKVNVYFE